MTEFNGGRAPHPPVALEHSEQAEQLREQIEIISLGRLGNVLPTHGTIGPEGPNANPEYNPAMAEVLKRKLSGFYRRTTTWMIKWCVDGRNRGDGTCEVAPNSAAGSIDLVEADALTSRNFYRSGDTITGHAERMFTLLKERNIIDDIGAHTGGHAEGDNSGCGANDKRKEVYGYMSQNGLQLKSAAETLLSKLSGSDEVTDATRISGADHRLIMDNVNDLLASNYITTGRSVADKISELGRKLFRKPQAVEALVGEHLEKAVVLNGLEGQSLDRTELAADEELGRIAQIFNLDVDALRKAAREIAKTPAEARQMFIAMLYKNLAVTCVLAHESLEVLVQRTPSTRFNLQTDFDLAA
jgi:hypothetical protein